MKPCPTCQTENADANKFCQHCGTPLVREDPPGEMTMRYRGQSSQREPMDFPEVTVDQLFGSKDRLVIGRAPDCDVCLPHPIISRYHAIIERLPDGVRLRDLASINGLWVNGKRISESATIREGDRVGIGPFLFAWVGGVVRTLDSSRGLRLEARNLEKIINVGHGQTRALLSNINLVVQPGEFVSVLGPSGSGKSTLMDCLNGRRRATGGLVLANGEDFYQLFDNFRQSLGYVPQKDIVHTGLTVERALYFTARLRLPRDTDLSELRARIDGVVQLMELEPHRHTLVGNLSGGQIKRVSLGAELLGEPSLLFIDEATSGLDAGTEARMMRLFRRLAEEGRSILCITHNVDNVEQCHLVIVLARGKLIYYGPPSEAPTYFGVSRISQVYDRIAEQELEQWEQCFLASPLHEEFIVERLLNQSGDSMNVVQRPAPRNSQAELNEISAPNEEPSVEDSSGPRQWFANLLADGRKLVSFSNLPPLADKFRELTSQALRLREWFAPISERVHQFRVLTTRFLELIFADPRSLRLLVLQAPIVALFLLLGFFDKDYQSTIPVPRPLNAHERKVLLAFQELGVLSETTKNITPEQMRELEKVKVEVPLKNDRTLELTGAEVATLLGQLDAVAANSPAREAIDKAKVTFTVDGQPVTLTRADVVAAIQQLHQSQLPAKLLAFQGPVVPDSEMINPRYTYMLAFIVVMVVLWFGCNNAAKEIVKEEAIYTRERSVNLHIMPYLGSKFLVLACITALHALLLMSVLYGTLHLLHAFFPSTYEIPSTQYMLAYPQQLFMLICLGAAGVALGLFISACVSSPDRANALLPYVLIPQMILGGGLLNVKDGSLFYLAATLSPVYWGYRAIHKGANTLPENFPGYVMYPDSIELPCLALVTQTVVLLLLTAWALRMKDSSS